MSHVLASLMTSLVLAGRVPAVVRVQVRVAALREEVGCVYRQSCVNEDVAVVGVVLALSSLWRFVMLPAVLHLLLLMVPMLALNTSLEVPV